MGQNISNNSMPTDIVDSLSLEVRKHAKVFTEIGTLTYEDFKVCLEELNELARKCLDTNGKQLIFVVKQGTGIMEGNWYYGRLNKVLWKATVKIACVKVDPINRKIENYKLLNLKQFLCVFKTFQSHLQNLLSSEEYMEREGNANVTASILLDKVSGLTESVPRSPTSSSSSDDPDEFAECIICMDSKTEVLLPCAHGFCSPCIEQWNENSKSCPYCSEILDNTKETWDLIERPGCNEISDIICSQLMNLSTDDTKKQNK